MVRPHSLLQCGMEVLGNLMSIARPGLGLVVVAGLMLMTGCTAKRPDEDSPSTPASLVSSASASASASASGTTPTPTSPAALEVAAAPALSLAGRYVPDGYRTASVVSGYDWATTSNEVVKEALSGRHLFQIACSGIGEVSVTMRVAGREQNRRVVCGEQTSVPFAGPLDAVLNGKPGNTGVAAWRVLPQS